MPLTTWLIPIYQCPMIWFDRCLESVFAQEEDYEVIIVSDGCPDERLLDDVDYYCDLNRRFRLIRRPHKGLVHALNFGLNLIDSKYVARLDADDFNIGPRLTKQLAFMEAHPEITLVGSSMKDADGRQEFVPCCPNKITATGMRYAQSHNLSYCFHPTWLFRREFMPSYNPDYEHAEDIFMLVELTLKGRKIANIPDYTVAHRMHPDRVSNLYRDIQKKNALRAIDVLERNGT